MKAFSKLTERVHIEIIYKAIVDEENPKERLRFLREQKSEILARRPDTESYLDVIELIDTEIEIAKQELDAPVRTAGFREMKSYAVTFYSQNKETIRKEVGDSGNAIATRVCDELKTAFPNSSKYPSPDTVRKDWLALTS